MTSDPTNVSAAEEDFIFTKLENILEGVTGANHVASGCVQDAFWFAGGTGSVEDEERVFGSVG